MFTRTRLAVATLAAAALPLAGFVLADVPHGFSLPGAAVAHAQTETSIPATGNLHIHKRLGLPKDETPHNGTEVDNPTGDAVPGVGYTVYRVLDGDKPIDLTTQDGWATAQGVKLEDVYTNGAPVQARVGAGQTATTGAGGTATFEGLAAGLYLVVEEDNPTDADGNALVPAAPFLVTVPMTNPEGNGWLSTVHVYPKNQGVDRPVKSVTDPQPAPAGQRGASVGDDIGFQIDTTIPKITPGNTFNGFLVTDKLPAGLNNPTVTVKLQGTALIKDEDYTLTSYKVGDQWVVRVQLTGNVLKNLHEHSGEVLRVNLVATVGSGVGVLENSAWVLPNDPGVFPDNWDPKNPGDGPNPGNESNTTRSVYGEITINKTNKDGTALNGATFELHRCTGNTVETKAPIKVAGATEFTTATTGEKAGQVVISGIHLANLQPGQAQGGTEDVWAGVGTNFCLVETKAPKGYSLLPQPFPVTLKATGSENALVTATADIQNVKTNAGFALPLTGGRGIWALIGGGVLLLLLAAAYYMKTRRSTGSAY
ncbi:SpaH/EbpB family LPXTG-anchored major pilin [Corynebacterium striatum]|uniref:SpaH/EbpB family LPXTG-anchored major pilin n=1 Tax=Corynebacterium striatum TaxID=43770 RepID=UPI0009BC5E64|nr:SpaH/EbpB family LPXTG-anchored major pilin [Corynebacterium striatum]